MLVFLHFYFLIEININETKSDIRLSIFITSKNCQNQSIPIITIPVFGIKLGSNLNEILQSLKDQQLRSQQV